MDSTDLIYSLRKNKVTISFSYGFNLFHIIKNQQILSYFCLVAEVKLAISSGEWRIIYYYIITCKYL